MEIFRGSLDNVSGSATASTELTGSRVSSASLPHNEGLFSSTPFSLVVLTNDAQIGGSKDYSDAEYTKRTL